MNRWGSCWSTYRSTSRRSRTCFPFHRNQRYQRGDGVSMRPLGPLHHRYHLAGGCGDTPSSRTTAASRRRVTVSRSEAAGRYHSPDPPPSRPSRPGPKPSPPATTSRRTTGSAATPSTPAAPSRCATTAACTTSAWAAVWPAPTSSSSPTTSTSASCTATPANSSANWFSTPRATTNHAAFPAEEAQKTDVDCKLCPRTSANDVPRHHTVAGAGFEPA